jgi:hypothetical protein
MEVNLKLLVGNYPQTDLFLRPFERFDCLDYSSSVEEHLMIERKEISDG